VTEEPARRRIVFEASVRRLSSVGGIGTLRLGMIDRRLLVLIAAILTIASAAAAMLASRPSRPAERIGPVDQADRRFAACHADPPNVTAAFAVDHVDEVATAFPAWVGGSPDLRGPEPAFVVVFATAAPSGPWALTSDEGPTDPPMRGAYRDVCVVIGPPEAVDPPPLLFQRVDITGMRPAS
jgi:hypothetical protein